MDILLDGSKAICALMFISFLTSGQVITTVLRAMKTSPKRGCRVALRYAPKPRTLHPPVVGEPYTR